MESTRQKKVSKLLQKDVAEVIQARLKTTGHLNILVSVTKLKVSVDLSVAKIFLSVFPTEMSKLAGLSRPMKMHDENISKSFSD